MGPKSSQGAPPWAQKVRKVPRLGPKKFATSRAALVQPLLGLLRPKMLTLSFPKGAIDLAEGIRVKDWTSEALDQVRNKVTVSTVEVGEVVALYHRNSCAELYGQRFIYMCEDEVYVYDSNGALIDDPSNGTPGGIQPLHGEGVASLTT